MVLSDRTIKDELAKGRIVIDPLGEDAVQPASVDLHLDRQVVRFPEPSEYSYLDVRNDNTEFGYKEEISDLMTYILEPGSFILASTLEYVELPSDIVARLEGKSSLGRLGLLIHSTAGYVDPGWKGQLTLEISNVASARIALRYGMKISQISFLRLSTPAENPYGSAALKSKYQGQVGPTPTRAHLDFGNGKETEKPARVYSGEPTELRLWLDGNEYRGSVARLAAVLQVPEKTVQDWVYGRYEPNNENREKLYLLTRIPRYDSSHSDHQPNMFSEGHVRLT